MSESIEIAIAAADDAPAVIDLVRRAGLPLDGLAEHLTTTVVARSGGEIIGVAALEIYRDGALLRSVAVDASMRGKDAGTALTKAALQLAERRGIRAIFLLTTTAERFFPRFGFIRIERDQVPEDVRQSVEFRSACPSSAVVMRKSLA